MKKLSLERTAKTDQTGPMPRLRLSLSLHWAHRSSCRFCHAVTQRSFENILFFACSSMHDRCAFNVVTKNKFLSRNVPLSGFHTRSARIINWRAHYKKDCVK